MSRSPLITPPGNMGAPAAGTDWLLLNSFFGRLAQVGFNGSVRVHCPIVRDNVLKTSGTNVVRVSVVGSFVVPRLISADVFGTRIDVVAEAQVQGSLAEITPRKSLRWGHELCRDL